jgi:hypothetical protein
LLTVTRNAYRTAGLSRKHDLPIPLRKCPLLDGGGDRGIRRLAAPAVSDLVRSTDLAVTENEPEPSSATFVIIQWPDALGVRLLPKHST